ncbi:MAG: glycerol acyltransferase [Cyanobacteria bacterium CRU_2_1]|nr:glycerol acyltransferase [Cyanobacteria bacterium RU_5_0]NJR60965.1 glycerol acyltransferase [Cyanobacteria bacterium CRU_2_1]
MRCDHVIDTTLNPTLGKGYKFDWFDWFCLWYPPGWLILFNRHWQHYHDDPQGWNWLEYALFLIPGGFYLASLIRWLRLGCHAPRSSDQTVDPSYQNAFGQEILEPILKHYFRAELHHPENWTSAPVVVAMNHAGMCFPWDMIGLGTLLNRTRGWFAKPLAHSIFFDHPWLKWWLPTGWLEALGGVRANLESFENAVQSPDPNTVLLYAPEGWHGLAKGWQQRHQLATFDPSFIRLSDRHRVPILPVICIGNEYLHPWTINIKSLARRIGLPIFPISIFIILFVLFPSMGVWANRTRLQYHVQPVVHVWEKQEHKTGQLQHHTTAYREAQELRSKMQSVMNHLVNS